MASKMFQEQPDRIPPAHLLWLAFLIVLLALTSCSLIGIEDDTGTTSPIDGRVSFSIYEGFAGYRTEQDPVVLLTMLTEKIYPCYNFSIVADVNVRPGLITIDLQHVLEPAVCLTALGPATVEKQLNIPAGTYALFIKSHQGTDMHALEVTSTYFQIRAGTSTVSTPQASLVWRVPERSFAFICGTTSETGWICADFADSLTALPGLTEFSFPDSGYVPFWPPSSDGYWHNEPARYFKYNSEADYDLAGAMLARYKRDVIRDQQGLGLWLVNWHNKKYQSWMMP